MLLRLLRTSLAPYRPSLRGRRRAAVRRHRGHALPAQPQRRHHRQGRRAPATPATSSGRRHHARASRSCRSSARSCAVWFGARTAMAFGRDVRRDLSTASARSRSGRCSSSARPSLITREHQRRPAGADAGADGLHDDGRRADHDGRRHRDGDARGLRPVVAARWSWCPCCSWSSASSSAGWCPSFRLMQERIDEVNRMLREQITGIRVVRAFVREPHETARFADGQRRPHRRRGPRRSLAGRRCSRP